MTRIIGSCKLRWISMVIVGWMLAGWCTDAPGQDGSSSVPPVDALPRDAQQELFDRLLKMEQRLEQVTKRNEELSREVQELRSVNRDQSQRFPPVPAVTQSNAARAGGTASFSQPSAGGGSKTSGGDPTTTGRAQEIGNPHLGKLGIKTYYDFDNDGFGFST